MGAFYAHLSQAHRMKFLVAKEKVRAAVARHQRKTNAASSSATSSSPEKAAPLSKSLSKQSTITSYLNKQASPRGEGASSSPSPSPSPSRKPAAATASDMPYLCGHQGCTFRARNKFEMSGHR